MHLGSWYGTTSAFKLANWWVISSELNSKGSDVSGSKPLRCYKLVCRTRQCSTDTIEDTTRQRQFFINSSFFFLSYANLYIVAKNTFIRTTDYNGVCLYTYIVHMFDITLRPNTFEVISIYKNTMSLCDPGVSSRVNDMSHNNKKKKLKFNGQTMWHVSYVSLRLACPCSVRHEYDSLQEGQCLIDTGLCLGFNW